MRDGERNGVVSRESPVVIVVIKWRLAGGLASVVCIRRGLEGNTNERDRERESKGEARQGWLGVLDEEGGGGRAEGSCP